MKQNIFLLKANILYKILFLPQFKLDNSKISLDKKLSGRCFMYSDLHESTNLCM